MIKLGILGSETEFEYGIIDFDYNVHGAVHTMADGSNRIQYAKSDKYIFNIRITYVDSTVWNSFLSELQNSKTQDLNLIDAEGNNYTVRIMPGTMPKTPIMGTALGYDISFSVIEV
jgi:hypothetical protein